MFIMAMQYGLISLAWAHSHTHNERVWLPRGRSPIYNEEFAHSGGISSAHAWSVTNLNHLNWSMPLIFHYSFKSIQGASQAVFDAEIQEYISDEDFHEIVKQIVTTLNEDEAVKDRHHVFAKVRSINR